MTTVATIHCDRCGKTTNKKLCFKLWVYEGDYVKDRKAVNITHDACDTDCFAHLMQGAFVSSLKDRFSVDFIPEKYVLAEQALSPELVPEQEDSIAISSLRPNSILRYYLGMLGVWLALKMLGTPGQFEVHK